MKKLQAKDGGEVHFKSHKLSVRGRRRPGDSFKTIMLAFLDTLLANLHNCFPVGSKNTISAFGVLAMRPLSFVSSDELTEWGNKELDQILSVGSKKKTAPHLVIQKLPDMSAWSVVKPLVLQQRYPRDRIDNLWGIIKQCHGDMFPNLLKLAAVALTLPIHTSDCERDFSLQNSLKTSERNRLLPQRVDTLMLISAEGPPIESFNFEPAVRRW